MAILQILSYESCGKTALCAGIGKKLVNAGTRVGYIKPIHVTGQAKDSCADAIFINEALELGENKEQVCPIHLSQEELWSKLSEDIDGFSNTVVAACQKVLAGKDVLIIESPGSLKGDKVSGLAGSTIAEKMDTRIIMLVCYSTGFKDPEIIQSAKKFGDRLVGVVVNQVPESKLDSIQTECSDYFKSQGVNLLGVLPESRTLLGVTVGEIATALGAEIISSKDKSGELVENFMLGAMTPDQVREYYDRKKNKAVVTSTERPDMQLAALDTSTKCLVVAGKKPSTSVMVKAEDKKVPVMVVDRNIEDIVLDIEKALSKARFHNLQKLKAVSAILDSRFDYKALNTALGLPQ